MSDEPFYMAVYLPDGSSIHTSITVAERSIYHNMIMAGRPFCVKISDTLTRYVNPNWCTIEFKTGEF